LVVDCPQKEETIKTKTANKAAITVIRAYTLSFLCNRDLVDMLRNKE
jgi:hypothetical protein